MIMKRYSYTATALLSLLAVLLTVSSCYISSRW